MPLKLPRFSKLIPAKFSTLEGALRKGGFKHGKDYGVLDTKAVFPIALLPGLERKIRDVITAVGTTGVAYGSIRPEDNFPIFPLIAGGAVGVAIFIQHKRWGNQTRLHERKAIKLAAKSLYNGARANYPKIQVTHAVLTRYVGKTIVLNNEAFKYLSTVKPKRVYGKFPPNGEYEESVEPSPLDLE